jgi:hypothetical protein
MEPAGDGEMAGEDVALARFEGGDERVDMKAGVA